MWLHKTEAWEAVCNADTDLLIFPKELQHLKHCVQRAEPFANGYVEKEKKSGNFTVKASALWFPIETSSTESDISKFVCNTFKEIVNNKHFHEYYSMVVSQLGSGAKTMQAIPGYYKEFDEALKHDLIEMVPHFSLDEIFTSKTIDEVMACVADISYSESCSKHYSTNGYELNHLAEFAFKP